MSAVYNPEADLFATIERLELEAREVRRRVQAAKTDADRHVLSGQLEDLQNEIKYLQRRLP